MRGCLTGASSRFTSRVLIEPCVSFKLIRNPHIDSILSYHTESLRKEGDFAFVH